MIPAGNEYIPTHDLSEIMPRRREVGRINARHLGNARQNQSAATVAILPLTANFVGTPMMLPSAPAARFLRSPAWVTTGVCSRSRCQFRQATAADLY